jgi:putative flippase GtrA
MVELWASAARFGVAGGLATAVHVILFAALSQLTSITPPFATVISFLSALSLSYRMHYSWTFRATGRHRVFFSRFFVIAVAGASLNYGIMSLSTELLGLSPFVGLAIVIGVVAPLSFLCSRYWGFR